MLFDQGATFRTRALRPLQAFTRALLNTAGHVEEEDLAAFLGAGYTAVQAVEVITQIAFTTLANLVANLADTPVDRQFAPQAWSAAAA
jgi:alkylhydroperoxidase family enzyme